MWMTLFFDARIPATITYVEKRGKCKIIGILFEAFKLIFIFYGLYYV